MTAAKKSPTKDVLRKKKESALRKKNPKSEKQEDKQEHYYSKSPTSEPLYGNYEIEIAGIKYNITTVSGVFGKKQLDPGTRLLINSAGRLRDEKVLDLGCGTGVVGLSLKIMNPKIKITLSDINPRAVTVARKNFLNNKVRGKFLVSDGLKKMQSKFDIILLNPPQSAGREVCERLIKESGKYLEEKGRLRMVARHNKGGKTLSEYMKKEYGNVKDIEKKGGYRVYESVRN